MYAGVLYNTLGYTRPYPPAFQGPSTDFLVVAYLGGPLFMIHAVSFEPRAASKEALRSSSAAGDRVRF